MRYSVFGGDVGIKMSIPLVDGTDDLIFGGDSNELIEENFVC